MKDRYILEERNKEERIRGKREQMVELCNGVKNSAEEYSCVKGRLHQQGAGVTASGVNCFLPTGGSHRSTFILGCLLQTHRTLTPQDLTTFDLLVACTHYMTLCTISHAPGSFSNNEIFPSRSRLAMRFPNSSTVVRWFSRIMLTDQSCSMNEMTHFTVQDLKSDAEWNFTGSAFLT